MFEFEPVNERAARLTEGRLPRNRATEAAEDGGSARNLGNAAFVPTN